MPRAIGLAWWAHWCRMSRLQFFGIGSFLLPVFAALLGARWFRSSKIQSPIARTLGGVWLVMFLPAMLALLPGHMRWMHVIPVEGLLGRIVGDFLIHYLNLVGAYIVCGTLIAVALYLSTAFSFAAVRLWAPTRFAFATALWNRYLDWQQERTKKRQQKELEKRRISKPVVKTQLIPSRPASPQVVASGEVRRTGIERMMADDAGENQNSARSNAAASSGGVLAESEEASALDDLNPAFD
jgi:S-DNA-T family DNA segregation ATPase FtsK/SpoIIIE